MDTTPHTTHQIKGTSDHIEVDLTSHHPFMPFWREVRRIHENAQWQRSNKGVPLLGPLDFEFFAHAFDLDGKRDPLLTYVVWMLNQPR